MHGYTDFIYVQLLAFRWMAQRASESTVSMLEFLSRARTSMVTRDLHPVFGSDAKDIPLLLWPPSTTCIQMFLWGTRSASAFRGQRLRSDVMTETRGEMRLGGDEQIEGFDIIPCTGRCWKPSLQPALRANSKRRLENGCNSHAPAPFGRKDQLL